MGKSIIPIGMSMGASLTSPTEGTFDVLVGGDLKEFTADEWITWGISHDNPRAHHEHRFDRAMYIEEINKNETTIFDDDLNRMIDKFIQIGAMVEIDLKKEPLEPFFRNYTIVPTARSHGNSATNLKQFGIGHDNEPEIMFSGWCQTIWAGAHYFGSLWNACTMLADRADRATAVDVANEFAGVLPLIVATQCGYLEPVR